MPKVFLSGLLESLPPEWPTDPFPHIQELVKADGRKVVVLDDDPTGTQTVHGVPVLTEWSVESLAAELSNDLSCFYILTNSRAVPLSAAQAINTHIGQNLVAAMRMAKRDVVLMSRSDSTLRGHYPGEVDALQEAVYGAAHCPTILVPAFFAGGRYTVGDVHYVSDGTWLTPASETEFAKDKAFGYAQSNLKAWVEEKAGGRIKAADVVSISIEDLREKGPDWVAWRLQHLPQAGVCIINALSERDLAVAVEGMLFTELRERTFVFRCAASLVQLRAGIAPKPLLTQEALRLAPTPTLPRKSEFTRVGDDAPPPVNSDSREGVRGRASRGALIIVGSYVPKTSGQVNALLQTGIRSIEVNVNRLLDDAAQQNEINQAIHQADDHLQRGEDVVIYTSRTLISGHNAESSLAIGNRVSGSLVAILRSISIQPRYILAKGGITSSDLATKGLGVKRAMVLGQILPGVPVWQLGPETKFPGLPYIVFPGNVGSEGALADVAEKLK
jgi:uncharacterized protein YgbK (DUF1537 family)